MTAAEKFSLWSFTEKRKLNDNTVVVQNNDTGLLMVKKTVDAGLYEIHTRLLQTGNNALIGIYDVLPAEENCTVLEEYVEGCTIEEAVEKNGCFSAEETARYMLKICDGVSFLHSLNIIHRDINPSNVMLTPNGEIKIIDFGIARCPKKGPHGDTRILGTAGYAAPEQFGFTQTDMKSDIYSIGVLMNYMLTGALPNENAASGCLKKIITKCTELDPRNRYGSVKMLRADIKASPALRKNPIRRIMKKIPGFRGKNFLVAIPAIYFYLIVLIANIAFLNMWMGNIQKQVEICGRFTLLFTLPFIFYTDFLDLSMHLPVIKALNKKKRRIIFSAIATVFLSAGIALLASLPVPQ